MATLSMYTVSYLSIATNQIHKNKKMKKKKKTTQWSLDRGMIDYWPLRQMTMMSSVYGTRGLDWHPVL